MNRSSTPALLAVLSCGAILAATVEPPNAGRGAGTVPLWNPHRSAPGNPPLTVRVLVLDYDPLVPAEGHQRLSKVFRWNNPAVLATNFKEAMEYASGGYLRFEIVEWRNINEIYAQQGGHRYTIEQYVRNRRHGKGWRDNGMANYPRLLHEQNVEPLIDSGRVDEVWIFSDHFFGLYEASMAGPGAFFINGGVYPQVKTTRPFAFYGFNYERGVAEMMHDASHRTESTLNRAYGPWNLKNPANNWEKFSANHDQSGGLAGVGTCHWPANAKGDYDYGNQRVVTSWADAFLKYPELNLVRKRVSRATWSNGPDYHLDYMKWYFAHVPRAAGVNKDGRQNNWFKYIFDFQSYDAKGKPLPASAELLARDVADPTSAAHTLEVAYRSADHIDPTSLGNDDLTVTAPDGKTLTVRLTSGNEPSERSYRAVRYSVTAPGGTWEKSPAGPYTVSLRANRVKTKTKDAVPARRLGVFQVVRAAGKGLTRGVESVSVEGPKEALLSGSQTVVRAFGKTKSGAKQELTREAVWTSSDAKVATVDETGRLRAAEAGKATLTARFGKLTATSRITVTDPGLPRARLLEAPDVAKVGSGDVTIVVTYEDPDGIRRDSVGLGNLRVFGPNGFHQFPEVAAVKPGDKSRKMTVSYRVRPPAEKWVEADRGSYTIEMKGFQVADTKGNHAAEGVLGRFRVLRPAEKR